MTALLMLGGLPLPMVYAIGKIGDSVKLLLDPDKLLHDDIALLEQVGGDETIKGQVVDKEEDKR